MCVMVWGGGACSGAPMVYKMYAVGEEVWGWGGVGWGGKLGKVML